MNALFILSLVIAWALVMAVTVFVWSRWGKTQKVLDEMAAEPAKKERFHTTDGGHKVCDGYPISMYETDPMRADQDSGLAWYYRLCASPEKAFFVILIVLSATLYFASKT